MPTFKKSYGIYAKAGLMLNGRLFPLPTWEPRIKENASGFWPTPNTEGFRSDGELRLLGKMVSDPQEFVGMSDRAAASKREKWFPTPMASDANKCGPNTSYARGNLTLTAYANRFPTPTANDWKGGTATQRKDTGKARQDRLDHLFEPKANGGKLNPMWVEWLMGWPIGWTDLEPLETDRFRQWLQKLGCT